MKVISNKIIRRLNPCYDPSEVVKDENEELSVKEWVAKYRDLVKDKSDIIWLLCNKLYMSEKDIRLFTVWNAREALKLVDNPDPRSIEACNVAERYANGKATREELLAAREDAWDATYAAWNTASAAAYAATASVTANAAAAWTTANTAANTAATATRDATRAAAWDSQIEQLLTYF